ncbi:hypothetical protein BY458DRAFT_539997 [Sporodiniella umbellata]|nr:hypothetical protein BY458DRAFT_539997 [Sporodiniella umbellata]
MKLSITTLFSFIVCSVFAQAGTSTSTAVNAGIACNKPGFGEVVTAGQPYSLSWTVTDANVKSISSISLVSGTSSNLQVYMPNILSSVIPTSEGQYSWNVPKNIETGTAYALAFKGENGQTTYSTYFTIIGAPVGTVNKNDMATNNNLSGSSNTPSGSSAPVAKTSSSSPPSQQTNSAAAATSYKIGFVGLLGAAVFIL